MLAAGGRDALVPGGRQAGGLVVAHRHEVALDGVEDRRRLVGRAVVDEDDLEGGLVGQSRQRGQAAQGQRSPIAGHDDYRDVGRHLRIIAGGR